MRLRLLAGIALWSCQALAVEPGDGYGVHVTWPPAVQHHQRTGTTPVYFDVEGCQAFTVQTQVRADENQAWHRTTQSFRQVPDGGYVADISVPEITRSYLSDAACYAPSGFPQRNDLQLVVTCQGDGREAVSQTIPMSFVIADAQPFSNGADALFYIDDHRQLGVGTGGIDIRTEYQNPGRGAEVSLFDEEHAFVRVGDRGYLSARCASWHCPPMNVEDPETHATLSVPRSELYVLDLRENVADDQAEPFILDVIAVPGNVLRLYADDDNSVVILAFTEPSANQVTTVISRLNNDKTPAVTVERVLPQEMIVPFGEAVPERPTPRSPWFLTFKFPSADDSVPPNSEIELANVTLRSLHAPRRSALIDLPGAGATNFAAVAPEGNQWVGQRGGRTYLMDLAATAIPLDVAPDYQAFSIAWSADTVAVSCFYKGASEQGHPSQILSFFSRTDGKLRGQVPLNDSTGLDMLTTIQILPIPNGLFARFEQNTLWLYNNHGEVVGGTTWPAACTTTRPSIVAANEHEVVLKIDYIFQVLRM